MKKLGIICGDVALYYKGIQEDYPNFMYELPVIKGLCNTSGYVLTILVDTIEAAAKLRKRGIKDLDGFGVRYEIGTLADVDAVFISQCFVTKSGFEQCKSMLDAVVATGLPLIYRDSDEETMAVHKDVVATTRISSVEYLNKLGHNYVKLVTSKRAAEVDPESSVYIPCVYCPEDAAYMASRIKTELGGYATGKYLFSIAGAMTGRKYYVEIGKELALHQPDKPCNVNIYMGRDYDFEGMNKVCEVKVGLCDPIHYFGAIGQSDYQIHGASWYAPRLRKQIEQKANPPYAVLKLLEGLYAPVPPLVITLDTPEVRDAGLPEEVIVQYPSLDMSHIPLDNPEKLEALRIEVNAKLASYFDINNWVDQLQRTLDIAGIK